MTITTKDQAAYRTIGNVVRQRSAIQVDDSKSYLVEARLTPIARDLGMSSLADLAAALEKPHSEHLVRRVVEAMTTHETTFFRDLLPFEALRTVVIPKLMQLNASRRAINIWSNACSSGQEAYSLAMLLLEHFPELAKWEVRILASDISSQVLERAQQGIFTQTEVNRGLPMMYLLRYFDRHANHFRVSDRVRKMVEFHKINLVEPFPLLPEMDVVMLRNVLIYFSTETKSAVLKKVRRTMHKESTLFLGAAESVMNLDVPFERQTIGPAVAYRPK